MRALCSQLLALAACTSAPASTTTTSASTTAASTALASTADVKPTDSTPTDAALIIAAPDHGCTGCALDCDLFAQDCPDGQKCVPVIEEGGSAWNALRCVPVTGDGLVGDPCSSASDGDDDCARGHVCRTLGAQPQGLCVAFCSGSERAPECPAGSTCTLRDDLLHLCIVSCDPLAQDCPAGALCIPATSSFECALDLGGDEGQPNDPCELPNACDPGLYCLDSAATSSACDPDAPGCCSPFCALPDGLCPNLDQQCVPLYDPPSPAGSEPIGVCTIPS